MFTVALLILFSVLCILLSGEGAWDNVTKPSRNALVFEGRPKDYGAFVLRRDYGQRFVLAFSGAVTFVSLAVIVPKVMALLYTLPPSQLPPIPIDHEHVITVVFPPDKQESQETNTTTAGPAGSTPVTPAEILVVDDTLIPPTLPDTNNTAPPIDTTGSAGAKGPVTGPVNPQPPGGGLVGSPLGKGEPTRGETLAHPPQFPGGEAAMYEFVKDHTVFPEEAMDVSEKIYVEFVIEEDGSVSTVTVVGGTHPSLKREATRVVRAMPRWSPGRMDDHAVRCRLILPINFTVSP